MPKLHTATPMASALRALLAQLEQRLALRAPLAVYLAGGMAVHLYTGARVTGDVDAEFGRRIVPPTDLMVEVELDDGSTQVVYLDTNYNPTFALLHEDYLDASIPVELGLASIRLYLLAPTDLAVSKIARWFDSDQDDVAALVRLGLTSADAIERRATEALAGYIGDEAMLRMNLREAVALARRVQAGGDAPAP